MGQDVFGSDRTVAPGNQIVTSEFAALNIGSKVALIQNCSIQYGREVRTMFEAGSSTLFLVHGSASGQVTANAAVGKKGFMQAISGGLAQCGRIDKMSVNLLPGGLCSVGASGGLSFSGAIVTGMNFAFANGTEAVTEGFTMMIPHMSKSS